MRVSASAGGARRCRPACLPPVARRQAALRDELAASYLAAGTPVLVQLSTADPAPALPEATLVVDLSAALLARDLGALSLDRAPAGTAAMWPLLPGLTDD